MDGRWRDLLYSLTHFPLSQWGVHHRSECKISPPFFFLWNYDFNFSLLRNSQTSSRQAQHKRFPSLWSNDTAGRTFRQHSPSLLVSDSQMRRQFGNLNSSRLYTPVSAEELPKDTAADLSPELISLTPLSPAGLLWLTSPSPPQPTRLMENICTKPL